MKKFYFLTLALICAFVANAKAVYLKPGSAWGVGNERYAVYTWDVTPNWYDMVFEETGIYKAELPDGVTNLILCRMNGSTTENNWDNKWDQTNNLKYDATKTLYTITSSSSGKGQGSWSVYTPVEKKSFTVYLLKSSTSWTNANIYAWNDEGIITAGWPGAAMNEKTVDGYDYFYYTIEVAENTASVSVVFNNGSEQTVDLTGVVTKDTYFELGGKDGNGKYAATSSGVPVAIEEVGVDAGEAVYYNLQGVKVANPENGIFIKKQGNKTTKVVL